MNNTVPRRFLVSALAVAAILGLAACVPAADAATEVAKSLPAAASVISQQSVLTHFDLTRGQLPENLAAAADGGVLMTFAASRQIAHVSAKGKTTIIATLPVSKDTTAKTPVLGFPLATGLVRDGKVIYALLATGAADTTGVWKIDGNTQPKFIASLPSTGLPNGLTLDAKSKTLFAADSVTGAIFSIPTAGGEATIWSQDPALRTTGFLGVNGLKLRGGAIYASNLDLGTIVRIPLKRDGSAGKITTIASDLIGIDDFSFTGNGSEIVATIDPANQVILVNEDGTHSVVLSAKDGLSNPTAALVLDGKLYVSSAAYVTQKDPNLLQARISTK